jgi:hypothetical protein
MNELREQIEKIFKESQHQEEVVNALYKFFIPGWESVKEIEGWPSAGYQLSSLIWQRFIEFDRRHHPDCVAGGAWLNFGFKENPDLDDWQVDLSTCTIEKISPVLKKVIIISYKGGEKNVFEKNRSALEKSG